MTAYARSTDPHTSWEAAETWKPIPGWEDLYEVSDHGKVRSLDRIDRNGIRRRGRVLKSSADSNGRLRLTLHKNGQRKSVRVHRLVLLAFVGPCPDGMEACHANDTPADNRLSNLRWDTPSANQYDAVRNGKHGSAKKTSCSKGHPFNEKNTYTTPGGKRNCRECNTEYAREYRRANPKMRTKWQREYRKRKAMILTPTRKEE